MKIAGFALTPNPSPDTAGEGSLMPSPQPLSRRCGRGVFEDLTPLLKRRGEQVTLFSRREGG